MSAIRVLSRSVKPSTLSVAAPKRGLSYSPFALSHKQASATATTTAAEEASETAQAFVVTQPQSATFFRDVPLGAFSVSEPYDHFTLGTESKAAPSQTSN